MLMVDAFMRAIRAIDFQSLVGENRPHRLQIISDFRVTYFGVLKFVFTVPTREDPSGHIFTRINVTRPYGERNPG